MVQTRAIQRVRTYFCAVPLQKLVSSEHGRHTNYTLWGCGNDTGDGPNNLESRAEPVCVRLVT